MQMMDGSEWTASLEAQLAECERSRLVYANDAATYSAKLGVLEDDLDELRSQLVRLVSAASSLLGYVEGKHNIQDGQFKCPYFQRLHRAVAFVQEQQGGSRENGA